MTNRNYENSIFPNERALNGVTDFAEFNEEERMIAQTVEQFVEEKVTPEMEQLEKHDYDIARNLFLSVGELGLLGVEVPGEYGGLEMGKKASGLVAEKMGFAASFSVGFNIHTGVGTLPYVYFGTEEQKATYLPGVATGEAIGAYALTEPNSGSDAMSLSARAKYDESTDEWILNGEKQWITNAHLASVYVVFARSEEGITAFIVERDYQGVSVGPEEEKLGIKGSSTATLILEDVRVPSKNVLGEVGKGHYIAFNTLNMARLKLAFSNIGGTKQALGTAIKYGKERKQFKTEIIKFKMIQEKIANIAVDLYGVESSAYYTAQLLENANEKIAAGEKATTHIAATAIDCAINKVSASEMLDYAVDEALQIHGGYGYMEEYPVERYYRDARINRIFEGTNEINRMMIAKTVLNQFKKDSGVIDLEVNDDNAYLLAAGEVLKVILKSVPELEKEKMDDEQEYLRLLADIVAEIYKMKSVCLRENHYAGKSSIPKLALEIICEEGYRKVTHDAISIIGSMIDSENEKVAALTEINRIEVPMLSNITNKKRAIAENLIEHDSYII